LNFRSAAEPEEVIDLCIGDVLLEYLMSKVSLCANQLMTIVKAESRAMVWPSEKANAYLEGLQARIS